MEMRMTRAVSRLSGLSNARSKTAQAPATRANSDIVNVIQILFYYTESLFIGRKVVSGRGITLHTETPRAIEFFIRFFINIRKPFTLEITKLARNDPGRRVNFWLGKQRQFFHVNAL